MISCTALHFHFSFKGSPLLLIFVADHSLHLLSIIHLLGSIRFSRTLTGRHLDCRSILPLAILLLSTRIAGCRHHRNFRRTTEAQTFK